MRLIEVAKIMVELMRQEYDKPPQSGPKYPEGMMLCSEWLDMVFYCDGRRRKVSMPRVLMQRANRDFQLGYIYSALVRKLRPKMQKCPDCGKLNESEHGFAEDTIYKMDNSGNGGCRDE